MTTNLKVALIGSGWSVKEQIPAWRNMGGPEVFGIWVRSEDKVSEYKQKLGVPLVTTDWKALISHPEVDIVSIVTPPFLHKEMTLFALQAKKHVICEKPFAMNISEAKEMLEVSKQHPNQMAWIDHELRFLEIFKHIKSVLSKSGKVLSIRCTSLIHIELDHNWSWWDEETFGGGLLGAIGSHCIDLLSYLTGLKISSVSAQLNSQVKTTKDGKPITSDDWFLLNVHWGENKVPGLIQSQRLLVPQRGSYSIIIQCEENTVNFEYDPNKGTSANFVATTKKGETLETFTEPPLPEPLTRYSIFTKGTGLLGKALVESIINGVPSPIPATFEDGVYIQAVLDTARESHRKNSVFVDVKY